MWQMIKEGGVLMVPIILCSVVGLAVSIERVWHLYRARIDTKKFMEAITGSIKRNKIIQALELCDQTPGPIAHIVKAGVLKHDRGKNEIKEAIEDVGLHEVARLEKNLNILATVAHICPLLGLLGTVTGMMEAFQVIRDKAVIGSPVNPGDLAGGISTALITTAAGLAVAIVFYVTYNYLVSRVENVIFEMEQSATDLTTAISQKGY